MSAPYATEGRKSNAQARGAVSCMKSILYNDDSQPPPSKPGTGKGQAHRNGVRPAPFATSVEAPPPLREHQHQNQHPEVSYEPEYDDPYGPLDPLPQDGYGGYGQHAHEDYNQPPLQGHYEVGYADTYEGAPTPAYGAPPGLSHPGYAPLSPGSENMRNTPRIKKEGGDKGNKWSVGADKVGHGHTENAARNSYLEAQDAARQARMRNASAGLF